MADRGAAPTAVLFDPTGKVGHAYDARTTPHMYVIDGEGALVYKGGIDDQLQPQHEIGLRRLGIAAQVGLCRRRADREGLNSQLVRTSRQPL